MKLEYYGGNGYKGLREIGDYEVVTDERKRFTKLSEARTYYNSLNEPKALWHNMDLIECHHKFTERSELPF